MEEWSNWCGGVVGKGWDEFFELKSKAFSAHRLPGKQTVFDFLLTRAFPTRKAALLQYSNTRILHTPLLHSITHIVSRVTGGRALR